MDGEENNNKIEVDRMEDTEASDDSLIASIIEDVLSNNIDQTTSNDTVEFDYDDDSKIEWELDKSGKETDKYLEQKSEPSAVGDSLNNEQTHNTVNDSKPDAAETSANIGDQVKKTANKNIIIIQDHMPYASSSTSNNDSTNKLQDQELFAECDSLYDKILTTIGIGVEDRIAAERIATVNVAEEAPSCSKESEPSTSGTAATQSKLKSKTHANRYYRSRSYVSSTDSDDLSTDDDAELNIAANVAKRQKLREDMEVENTTTNATSNNDDNAPEEEEEENGSASTRNGTLSPAYSLSSISDATSSPSIFNVYSTDDDDDDDEDEDEDEYGTASNGATEDLTFLYKEKPKHEWIAVRELMYREIGLSGRGRRSLSGKSSTMFQKRISGSLNSVERLELMGKLKLHNGCVNSLNFNKTGNILATGSDDLKIVLWNWAFNKPIVSFNSGHSSNVFQTKFIDLGNSNINIISSARDGQLRHIALPPGCCKIPITKQIYRQCGSVHKIAIPPTSPFEVLSASEDGTVYSYDFRDNETKKLLSVKSHRRAIQLYSISAHPMENEFCVCGRDQFVRVFDRRTVRVPIRKMTPEHLADKKPYETNVTCAVYNSTGSEILASYSDDDIFLFDNVAYEKGKFLHRYRGHSNTSTIKGVNFFGPNSEFVMSGSDCGYFFMWDKKTEAIVQWQHADEIGVVNCLEPHPEFPMMATSGLDHDVKIWVPSNENKPSFDGLEKKVRRNLKSKQNTFAEDVFDEQLLNFLMRMRNLRHHREGSFLASSSDDNEDDSDDDFFPENPLRSTRLRSFPCSPS